MKHCLEDDELGDCLCMLEEGHQGEHDFVPKSEIMVKFIGDEDK